MKYIQRMCLGMAVGWLFSALVFTPPIDEVDGWAILVLIAIASVMSFDGYE